MKQLIIMSLCSLLFYLSSGIATSSSVDPLNSPQWSAMHERFLKNEPVVFDEKVKVFAPKSAEDSLNVPVSFKVSGIEPVQEVIVLADLNPLPQVLRFYPEKISPSLAFRIKLQQGSPVRVAAKDSKGVWHVGGVWVDAAGGGCTLPSNGSASGDWSSTLGQVSAQLWKRNNNNRLRVRLMHPMDTGLASGVPRFHIEEMAFKDKEGNTLARLKTYEPISENPMLSLDIGEYEMVYLSGRDNNGNEIDAKVTP